MQKKSRMKATAILLVFCLIASLVPAPMRAQAVETQPEQTEQPTYTLQDAIAGIIDYTELYDPLDPATVPEIVGYENAVNKGHVQRLYTDEGDDLNKVVFLNADGSKTLYTYDFPVKYIDENGTIRDVSLEIADTLSGYETASSGAMTTFSAQATDGIHLSGNDTQITLVPVLPQVTPVGNGLFTATATDTVLAHTAQRVDENTIEYRYDSKTTIEYSLTYTGFKEDIVVSEYTGQTEYDFRLYTNGLALTEIDGSLFLVDEAGAIKATIGDIIIFTADERNNTFGQLVSTTIVENEEYLLTILIDPEYLADENTAYPIRIDPTVELNYDANGAGAIADVTVHSSATSKGTLGSLYLGLKDGSGISRALIKFPGLDLDSMGDNVTVLSSTLTMRDLMCESTAMDIECYVFAGNTWAESTANWTNTNTGSSGSVSTHLCTVTMDYDIGRTFTNKHWYTFDLVNAVQGWLDGYFNPEKGIMLKMPTAHENGSTYTYRTIGSYNRSSNKPTFSVTYTTFPTRTVDDGTYYFNNKESGAYLKLSSGSIIGVNGYISGHGNTIQWVVKKLSAGYVIRAAQNQNLYLAVPQSSTSNSVTTVTVAEDTEIPETCYWSVITVAGGCIIENDYNSRYLYIDSAGNVKTDTTFGGVGSEIFNMYIWRLATHSQVSGHELPANTALGGLQLSIGASGVPTIFNVPTGTIWAKMSDFTYSGFDKNGINICKDTGEITGKRAGNTTVTATHKVTGTRMVFSVAVAKLLVYQTAATYFHDEDGNYAPDMTYDDKSMLDITLLNWPDWEECLVYPPEHHRSVWENMVTTLFTTGELELVILDMIDHFMEGTGASYSNNILTNAIVAHPETTGYTLAVQSCIKELLTEENGNISNLEYTAADRNASLLRGRMAHKEIVNPSYDTNDDTWGGLRICVDSLWGVKIEVNEFVVNGSSYNCVLHYTFYDHFGLDPLDVQKFGFLNGFRSWYILQHYEQYDGAYKPFLTLMEFEKSFSGTI